MIPLSQCWQWLAKRRQARHVCSMRFPNKISSVQERHGQIFDRNMPPRWGLRPFWPLNYKHAAPLELPAAQKPKEEFRG